MPETDNSAGIRLRAIIIRDPGNGKRSAIEIGRTYDDTLNFIFIFTYCRNNLAFKSEYWFIRQGDAYSITRGGL